MEIIEALTPAGWSVEVWRLPHLGPNDSKRQFKQIIRQIFARLPSPENFNQDSLPIEMTSGFDGELSLTIKPGRKGKRAAPVRGVASGPVDTEQRIQAAVASKKKQLRKTTTPAVLAVNTSPFGDLEEYDQALFGLTFERVDHEGKTIRTGNQPVSLARSDTSHQRTRESSRIVK